VLPVAPKDQRTDPQHNAPHTAHTAEADNKGGNKPSISAWHCQPPVLAWHPHHSGRLPSDQCLCYIRNMRPLLLPPSPPLPHLHDEVELVDVVLAGEQRLAQQQLRQDAAHRPGWAGG
jgi:hypothetical protein